MIQGLIIIIALYLAWTWLQTNNSGLLSGIPIIGKVFDAIPDLGLLNKIPVIGGVLSMPKNLVGGIPIIGGTASQVVSVGGLF